ncbi:hypothetical protein QR680_010757 [Steinernema hermaphroditum]|uniref:C3H1-type domain-containing protein n=1 Tax=Steinernema hermaphroditum TaxID=289476 RepID=A0AA39MC31_9BILA|nr:hypothetical protein QR680_010757 [Steinernema hermaphroditum]
MAFGDMTQQQQNRRSNGRPSQKFEFYINDDIKKLLGSGDDKENAGEPQRRGQNSISPRNRHRQSLGGRTQKPSAERIKTELCENMIKTGTCDFGEGCWFAHGEEELRVAPRGSRQNGANNKRRKSYSRRSNVSRNNVRTASPQEAIAEEPKAETVVVDVAEDKEPEVPEEPEQPAPEAEPAQPAAYSQCQQYYPQDMWVPVPPPPSNVYTRFNEIATTPEEYSAYYPTIDAHAKYVEEEMKWILSVWDTPVQ